MATYLELHALASHPDLVSKVTTAIAVAAESVRTEDVATPNHDQRISWAKRALQNPDGEARKIMWMLMAQNASLTQAQILSATDAAIQAAVSNAIELFAG